MTELTSLPLVCFMPAAQSLSWSKRTCSVLIGTGGIEASSSYTPPQNLLRYCFYFIFIKPYLVQTLEFHHSLFDEFRNFVKNYDFRQNLVKN